MALHVWLLFSWLVLSSHGLRLNGQGIATRPRYIFLISGDEGMGSWRHSIADLMFLSKYTNSILVVPCIGGGRLRPCYDDVAKYTLFDYFDEGSLKSVHKQWITYDDFVQQATTNNLSASIWCAHTGPPASKCPEASKFTQWNYSNASEFSQWSYSSRRRRQHGLDLAGVQDIWGAYDVLAVYSYFRGAFKISRSDRTAGLSALIFTKALQTEATRLTSKLGLVDGYTAIQWRTETVGHYKPCSDFLGQFANNNTLLISDISSDPKKILWGGMTHHSSKVDEQQQSLKSLFDRGVRKLDQLPELDQTDMGMLSLLDLLLGTRAARFYTCIDGSGICTKCMRTATQFGRDIINERQKEHKTSYTSWDFLARGRSRVKIQGEDDDCPAETAPDFTLSICRKYEDEVGEASGDA